MKPPRFEYHAPTTVEDALDLLARYRGEAKVLAGGQSLMPLLNFRLARPAALIDLNRIAELAYIREVDGQVRLGAMTRQRTLEFSPVVRQRLPLLAEATRWVGHLPIRTRGTIGGSIAHADPAADFPTVLMALGTTILAKGPKGARRIAAEEFFVDLFTTALKPGEIVTAIVVPAYGKGTGGAYLKHPHPASRYAVVGVAAIVEVKDGKVARASLVVGGTTVNPVRAAAAEGAVVGAKPDAASIGAAAGKVAGAIEDPLSDYYASGEFRVHLATVLARRALAAAADRARG